MLAKPARIAGIVTAPILTSDTVSDLDPKVILLPLTRERATELVRDIEKADRWISTVKYEDKEAWRTAVNRRQIGLCLREGYVLDDRATLDEHGYWRFQIAQVCSGLHVKLDVALERTPEPRLFVVHITGDVIPL